MSTGSTGETAQRPHMLRVLSLDGGGIRGLSSLIILREMMGSIQHALAAETDYVLRPCDIFELIVGTGTGGISAILLGRMRLSVDQAIHEYIRMADNLVRSSSLLFQLNPLRPVFEEKVFGVFLDQVVSNHLGGSDALIFDPTLASSSGCRTAVLAATSANLDAPPYIFRTYSSNPNFKITDVARATSATAGIFPPVSLSFPPMQFVDAGSAGYNNPTEIALDEARELWPENDVDFLLSIGTGMQPIVDASQDKYADLSQRLMTSCEAVHERVCRRLPPTKYFRFSVPQGLEDISGKAWDDSGLAGRVAEITSAYLRKAEPSRNLTSCVKLLVSMKAHHRIKTVPIKDDITATTCSHLCNSVLSCVERVIQLNDILPQARPYAEAASIVLTDAKKTLEHQLKHDAKIKLLLLAIRDTLVFVKDDDAASRLSNMQDTISSMMAATHECALFMQAYGKKYLDGQSARDNLSTEKDDRIELWIAAFHRLKSNYNEGINSRSFSTICQLVPTTETTEADRILETLPGWNLNGVKFNESKTCLGGTRLQLMDEIRAWAYSPDERGILWLSGGAGTGKTSVANSIAVFFDNLGRLGACFCFNSDTAELSNPSYVFGNLCYQLAHFERGQLGVRNIVLSAIRSMGYVSSSSLQSQARRLIVDTTDAADLIRPVVVVIDALDESGSVQARKELVTAIASEFPKLPRSIKVMITSRDESDLRASLQDCSKELCIDDAENTPEDIASYIEYRLKMIRRHSRLSERWPGADKSQELVRRAGTLFVWAAVACNFIEEKRNPSWRLDHLLDATSGVEGPTGTPLKKLDILYSSILRNAFPDEDDPLTDFHYVVGSIIALESPLTRIELDSLLGLGDESNSSLSVLQNDHEIYLSSSEEIVSLLRSILREDSTDSTGANGPLRLLHPSLYEFLTTRADGNFRIDCMKQNQILAIRCLSIMNDQLQFDICKIGNPSLLNKEIEDLPKRIDDYISAGLRYSCCSIGYHILKVLRPDAALRNALKKLLADHFLHWIEVMSLLGEVSRIEGCLSALDQWVKDHANNDDLLQALVMDAILFLKNSGYVIRLSALHTYFSALPLAPKKLNLLEKFTNVTQTATIISSHSAWPTAYVQVMEGHTGSIMHLTSSPDGKKLASASYDMTVQLWDFKSGQAIGEALKGHTGCVMHVEFSPDGKKLASASKDKTVQLWDVESGQVIGEALKGHTGAVNHVMFSPDGKYLASASDDKTLQIWNVESGTAIRSLMGHSGGVTHVVFSPDGMQLASASKDKTARLWDVESILSVEKVFNGHSSIVNCVQFSPDGRKLASASNDGTVILWDVKRYRAVGKVLDGHAHWVPNCVFSPDGRKLASASLDRKVCLWDIEHVDTSWQAFAEDLQGHTNAVCHCAFSPDGKKLASASGDWTVRLWDVETGKAIGDPLRGHTETVCRVVFSPDGEQLASASFDSTVRLWNLDNDAVFRGTFSGHARWVQCVVFSPDGRMLASASYDRTIRLWDVESGKAIPGALRGHTNSVIHVAFSPDGRKLASGSSDNTVRLWDIRHRRAIGEALNGHSESVFHVVFSPDGHKVASASYYGEIWLWDAENGQGITGPLGGHSEKVNHIAFSRDGKKMASASKDKTVRLWDVESGQGRGAFEGHARSVNYVVFSPDGEKMASGADDLTVRLWDIKSGEGVLQVLREHTGEVLRVVFSRNGKELASATSDGVVRRWDVQSGEKIGDALEASACYMLRGQTKRINQEEGVWDSIDVMVEATTSFDQLGFLRHGTKRILWLPITLRGCLAARSSLVAVGSRSGAVTIIKLPTNK